MAELRRSVKKFLIKEYDFEEHAQHSIIGYVNGFTVMVTAPPGKREFYIRVGGIAPRGAFYQQRQACQKLLDNHKLIHYIVRYEYCFEIGVYFRIPSRNIHRTIQNSIEEITSFMKRENFEDAPIKEQRGNQIFGIEKERYSTQNLTEKNFFAYIQLKNLSSAPIARRKKIKGYVGAFIGSLIGILFWGYFAKLGMEKLLLLSFFPGYILVKCTFDGFARMTKGEIDRRDVFILTLTALLMNLVGTFFVGAISLQEQAWGSGKEYLSLTQSYWMVLKQFAQSPFSFGVLLVNYVVAFLMTLLFGRNLYKEARVFTKM